MRVQGRGLSGTVFLRGELFAEVVAFRLPSAVFVGGENLGETTPPDIAHQRLLFLGRGPAAFALDGAKNLNGPEIAVALLLERASPQVIAGADAIADGAA